MTRISVLADALVRRDGPGGGWRCCCAAGLACGRLKSHSAVCAACRPLRWGWAEHAALRESMRAQSSGLATEVAAHGCGGGQAGRQAPAPGWSMQSWAAGADRTPGGHLLSSELGQRGGAPARAGSPAEAVGRGPRLRCCHCTPPELCAWLPLAPPRRRRCTMPRSAARSRCCCGPAPRW